MNLHTNFIQLWSSRFHCSMDAVPQLNCLKADQFQTVNEQRAALEMAHSEVSARINHLQTSLNQELFVSDYLRTCITKLSAVSRVFNELENGDENSSTGNRDVEERPPSLKMDEHRDSPPAPPRSDSNSTANSALNLSVATPSPQAAPLPLLPSSFFNSSSPLLSATSRNLLLHSALNPQSSKSDSIQMKQEPSPVSQCMPPTTMEEAVRCMVDDISAATSKANCGHAYHSPYPGNHHSSHQDHSFPPHLPAPPVPQGPSQNSGPLGLPSDDFPPNTFNAARAAAAAVSAALGFHFPPPDMFNLNPPHPPLPPHSQGQGSSGNQSSSKNGTAGSSPDPQNAKNSTADDYASRPYRCTTCGRGFAVKAGLMQHLRTHTDERPYPCPECGRAFKQKIQLTTHMRVHSGERPYGCRICGKLFRQQSHVVQHLRTHTGEKPHKCTRCNKAFRQKYSLISHQRRMCQSRSSTSSALMAGMTMWIGPGGRAAEKAAAKAAAAAAVAAAAAAQNGLRPAHSNNQLPPPPPPLPMSSVASPLSLSFNPPPLQASAGSSERNMSPGEPSKSEERGGSISPASSHGAFRQPSPQTKLSNSPPPPAPTSTSSGMNSAPDRSFHDSNYPSAYHTGAADLRLHNSGSFQSRREESSSTPMETAGV